MRFLCSFLGIAAITCFASAASGVSAPPKAGVPLSGHHAGASSGALTAAPGTRSLRSEPDVRYGAPPPALSQAWDDFLVDTQDARWTALWDTATLHPLRIFGGSIPAPGCSSSPTLAEKHAREFLTRHGSLLLAGRPLGEFDLVANNEDKGLRTVAFQQMANVGSERVPVLSGRVNLQYKADRLFVLGGESLPSASFETPQFSMQNAMKLALAHIQSEQPSVAPISARLAVLPLVFGAVSKGKSSFQLTAVWEVLTQSAAPEHRTTVYVDARSGAIVATQEGLRFLNGSLQYEAPIRGPQEHSFFPASKAHVVIDGKQYSADAKGDFTFAETATSLTCFARSGVVNTVNMAGDAASLPLDVVDGVSALWSLKDDELGDAQLSAFIHASIAKDWARQIDPQLTFLNQALTVRVNGSDSDYACNAFFNGYELNFFQSFEPCNNTARLADVVYHEFGHAFHFHTLLDSVGVYDTSLSEGAADYFSSIVTSDPYLSPGFFEDGGYLREFDTDFRWPDDISWDPHQTGLIFAGAMWDLRTLFSEEMGAETGAEAAHQLYRAALRLSPNIPATFPQILAADDDDGDIGNGTPHVCQIMKAFAPHGLTPYLTASGLRMAHTQVRSLPSTKEPYPFHVSLDYAFPQCKGAGESEVDEMALVWRTPTQASTILMSKDGDGYTGSIPWQPVGTQIRYSIRAQAGGLGSRLPQNIADTEYKAFVGETTPQYCTDFESGAADWVFGEVDGKATDFVWGQSLGKGGDPLTAYSGQSLIGTTFASQGKYRKFRESFATGPVVDVGEKKHLRLQFMRWLSVEDGYFDQAEVTVNGQVLWVNQATSEEDGSLTHEDQEWRFEDLDISKYVTNDLHNVQVGFRLRSDDGTEYGGWNIDDVCVVSWEPPPPDPGAGGAGGDGGQGGSGGSGAGPGADDPAVSCSCKLSGRDETSTAGWSVGALVLVCFLGVRQRSSMRRRRQKILTMQGLSRSVSSRG